MEGCPPLRRGCPILRHFREAREIAGRLERRRSGYLDLAADGDIRGEELRHKLSEIDDQRDVARKALREAKDREETIRKLQRDREIMFRRFSAMRGMDLRSLDPENRRRVLQALRLCVEIDKRGDARISGVFDAAITELLPMAQVPADEPYTVKFKREIPPPFKSVVTLDNSPPCSKRTDNALKVRFSATLGEEQEVELALV